MQLELRDDRMVVHHFLLANPLVQVLTPMLNALLGMDALEFSLQVAFGEWSLFSGRFNKGEFVERSLQVGRACPFVILYGATMAQRGYGAWAAPVHNLSIHPNIVDAADDLADRDWALRELCSEFPAAEVEKLRVCVGAVSR